MNEERNINMARQQHSTLTCKQQDKQQTACTTLLIENMIWTTAQKDGKHIRCGAHHFHVDDYSCHNANANVLCSLQMLVLFQNAVVYCCCF